jgi:hypothetical protein
MSSRNAANILWSEMVTGLLSFGLPSQPSYVLTPEKGCPVRLHKCSAIEDFTRSPWARVLHIYDLWREGGPAIIMSPDTGLPVSPRITPTYLLGSPSSNWRTFPVGVTGSPLTSSIFTNSNNPLKCTLYSSFFCFVISIQNQEIV